MFLLAAWTFFDFNLSDAQTRRASRTMRPRSVLIGRHGTFEHGTRQQTGRRQGMLCSSSRLVNTGYKCSQSLYERFWNERRQCRLCGLAPHESRNLLQIMVLLAMLALPLASMKLNLRLKPARLEKF